MKHFTKSISIFALAAGLATFGPNEMPTPENNYSFLEAAEAQFVSNPNWKRARTRVRPTFEISRITINLVSQTDANEEAVAKTARVALMTSDGTESPPETVTAPKVERVYFDWSPPEGFEGGTVYLNCLDCDNAFDGLPIELGVDDFSSEFELGNNLAIEGNDLNLDDFVSLQSVTQPDIKFVQRRNGDFRFSVRVPFGTFGNGKLAVNDEPTDFVTRLDFWAGDLTFDGFECGSFCMSTVELLGDSGEILDIATTAVEYPTPRPDVTPLGFRPTVTGKRRHSAFTIISEVGRSSALEYAFAYEDGMVI